MQLFAIIPQALGKTDSPTFTGLTITSSSVLGFNSAVFQPTADSTTFFQIKNAAGTVIPLTVDTTNGIINLKANPVFQAAGTQVIKFDDTNYNILLGSDAFNNDEGIRNVGIGYRAGYNNDITGAGNEGDRNVYIGYKAGYGATGGTKNTGLDNVYVGYQSGYLNTSGGGNIFFGSDSGYSNTSGFNNIFLGFNAGLRNTAGFQNVVLGTNAYTWSSGNENLIMGYNAGGFASGATNIFHACVCIGTSSGINLTTALRSIFIGRESGYNQTSLRDRLIIDNQNRGSAAAEITDCLIYGVMDATPASQSLRFNVGTTIWGNATHTDADGGRASIFDFKGQQSGGEETTLARIEVGHDGSADDQKGYLDIFINDGDDGDSPTKILRIDSTGLFTDRWLASSTNTFLGINVAGSGNLDTGGLWNTATGSIALEDITTGPGNTVTGYGSGSNITEGGYNSGNGYNTLFNTTLGYYNTAMGHLAGYTNTIGNGSVFLGRGAGYWETGSDKLFIDNSTRTNEADGRVKALIYGIFDAAVANQSLTINGLISGSYGAKIGDGGTTNYLNVDSGGRVLLVGTAQTWEDIRIVPGAFQFPGVADPTLQSWQPGGAGATYKVYKFLKNDEVHFTCQIPHNYKEGSDIKPHIHWTPCDRGNEENGNTVGWKIDYSWANSDAVFASSTTVDLSHACSGTDDQHEMTDSGTITGTNKDISGVLQIRLYRSDTNADDTWVGATTALSPAILEFDLHYEIDSLGSDLELVKDAP